MRKEKCSCTCHILIRDCGYKKENIKEHHCCPDVIEIEEVIQN